MNRQFAHLKMLKRAGRGALKDGRSLTALGELAIRCPGCPRPGYNLPADWESMPPEKQYAILHFLSRNLLTISRFLYRLLIALDANFRLKNLRRPSTVDPGLHTGWAYFVELQPYLDHIAKYPKQKDVSFIIISL